MTSKKENPKAKDRFEQKCKVSIHRKQMLKVKKAVSDWGRGKKQMKPQAFMCWALSSIWERRYKQGHMDFILD